jgi:hypothetical protein
MPERIQRKRTRGWRMPEGAVYVGRPGPWANPFRIGHDVIVEVFPPGNTSEGWACGMPVTPQLAVDLFRAWVLSRPAQIEEYRAELRGRDLACWCPLDQPCHADVLLEIANR